MVEKLLWYGTDGTNNIWIQNLLKNRTQSVLVERVSSGGVPVVSEYLRTLYSASGLYLFLFYINNIADGLKSTLRLFADDTMAYRYLTIKSDQDARKFQKDLDKLTE